ncbi:MAG: hypothetical protein IPQ07_37285 [Myxococcales bacterium]|nr:hypothetical protein [Myxococcales bacterium]
MTSANFSRDVLAHAPALAVVPVTGSGWSDWGSPARVFASLEGDGESDHSNGRADPRRRRDRLTRPQQQRDQLLAILHDRQVLIEQLLPRAPPRTHRRSPARIAVHRDVAEEPKGCALEPIRADVAAENSRIAAASSSRWVFTIGATAST